MPQQSNTKTIVGNSGYDNWYFTITGTNQLWEDYIANVKRACGTGHWIETHRDGGTGGMYRVNNCVIDMQCAAFRIAAVTGMQIKDETDYDTMWTYSTKPPKLKITLSIPDDKFHYGDIVLEGFCNTFIPRRQKKKELERNRGKCPR